MSAPGGRGADGFKSGAWQFIAHQSGTDDLRSPPSFALDGPESRRIGSHAGAPQPAVAAGAVYAGPSADGLPLRRNRSAKVCWFGV